MLSEPIPEVLTRVVVAPDDRGVLTSNQETDARTAMTRGLAEFLSQQSIEMLGGRVLTFAKVFDVWAEPEDEAEYPSAAVYSDDEAAYDDSKFTGEPDQRLPEGGYLLSTAEMVLDITIDIWTTDPGARMGFVMMLEDQLDPTDFRYGLLLELPHYFNQRASFEKLRMAYLDGEDSAQRRVRRATIVLRGRVPVTRLVKPPTLIPKTRVTVT